MGSGSGNRHAVLAQSDSVIEIESRSIGDGHTVARVTQGCGICGHKDTIIDRGGAISISVRTG